MIGTHHPSGITRNGNPWFVASDVCRVLELDNVTAALRVLDADEKGLITDKTPGGEQMVNAISEPGLYKLLARSRKPEEKGVPILHTRCTLARHTLHNEKGVATRMDADKKGVLSMHSLGGDQAFATTKTNLGSMKGAQTASIPGGVQGKGGAVRLRGGAGGEPPGRSPVRPAPRSR